MRSVIFAFFTFISLSVSVFGQAWKKEFERPKCFIENHVNVITGNVNDLKRIYNSLTNKKTIIFIKELIGNTQLSQHELQNIIPIF